MPRGKRQLNTEAIRLILKPRIHNVPSRRKADPRVETKECVNCPATFGGLFISSFAVNANQGDSVWLTEKGWIFGLLWYTHKGRTAAQIHHWHNRTIPSSLISWWIDGHSRKRDSFCLISLCKCVEQWNYQVPPASLSIWESWRWSPSNSIPPYRKKHWRDYSVSAWDGSCCEERFRRGLRNCVPSGSFACITLRTMELYRIYLYIKHITRLHSIITHRGIIIPSCASWRFTVVGPFLRCVSWTIFSEMYFCAMGSGGGLRAEGTLNWALRHLSFAFLHKESQDRLDRT